MAFNKPEKIALLENALEKLDLNLLDDHHLLR
jgi:hypothetical protein